MTTRKSLIACVLLLLVVSATPALARWRSSGDAGCGDFSDNVNSAQDGDVLTPMYEQDFGRNTNGVVITKQIEVEGGWSSGTANCNTTNSFDSPEAMLAAGFVFDRAQRTDLRAFGDRVLGASSTVKSLKLRNLRFTQFDNFTGNGAGFGQSGAGLSGATIELDNSLFQPDLISGLAATGNGGGLYIELDGSSVLRITNSTFSGNSAANGGAIQVRLRGNSTLIIAGSTFQNNTATGSGGAIRVILEGGSVVIADTSFEGNTAASGGRDIRIEASGVSALAQSAQPKVFLLRNTYSGSNSVSITGIVTVYDEQVALPLLRK